MRSAMIRKRDTAPKAPVDFHQPRAAACRIVPVLDHRRALPPDRGEQRFGELHQCSMAIERHSFAKCRKAAGRRKFAQALVLEAQSRLALVHMQHLAEPMARAPGLHQRPRRDAVVPHQDFQQRSQIVRVFDLFELQPRRTQPRGDRIRIGPLDRNRVSQPRSNRGVIFVRQRLPTRRHIDAQARRHPERARLVEHQRQLVGLGNQQAATTDRRPDRGEFDQVVLGNRQHRVDFVLGDKARQPIGQRSLDQREPVRVPRSPRQRPPVTPQGEYPHPALAQFAHHGQPDRTVCAEHGDFGRSEHGD